MCFFWRFFKNLKSLQKLDKFGDFRIKENGAECFLYFDSITNALSSLLIKYIIFTSEASLQLPPVRYVLPKSLSKSTNLVTTTPPKRLDGLS